MPAEFYSASLISRFAVPGEHRTPQGYYRSKLFINSSTTNPLVAAAGPLFSLLERLGVSPNLPPISSIRDNIEHELHAFHSKLGGQRYADEFIVVASYLLCATIDELLGKNYLRLFGKPAEFRSFTPLSNDQAGPQHRFFEIIHHIKERANQYLDLLELGYYCLIAGFEGEHHLRTDGRQILDNLTEELYQLILQHRVNKPHQLFENQTNTLLPEPKRYKPLIFATLLTCSALVLIYLASHTILEHNAKTVLIKNTVLSNMDHYG